MASFKIGMNRGLIAVAAAVLILAVPGSAVAAQGDVVFSRLSGLGHGKGADDYWNAVAPYGNSIFVGGEKESRPVLRRYSRAGDVVWTRVLPMPDADTTSGGISGLAADSSGLYVSGWWEGSDGLRGFVARYQPNATRVWFDDVGPNFAGSATAIDTYGSYIYVVGQLRDPVTRAYGGTYVRKYTRDEVNVWTRRIAPDPNAYLQETVPSGIAVSADSVYVTGTAYLDATSVPDQVVWVRKWDQEGDYGWTDARPISDRAQGIAIATDETGAYVVAQAETVDPEDVASYGSFLLKYDHVDGFLWQRRVTARSSTLATGVAVSGSRVWITGTAYQRLTNQAGTSADPNGDAFLVRYSRDGSPQLTYQYSDPDTQVASHIAADYGGIYICGWASGFGGQSAGPNDFDGLMLSAELP